MSLARRLSSAPSPLVAPPHTLLAALVGAIGLAGCSSGSSSTATPPIHDASVGGDSGANSGRDASDAKTGADTGPHQDGGADTSPPSDAPSAPDVHRDTAPPEDAGTDAVDAPSPHDAIGDAPARPACDQTLLDYPLPPAKAHTITPRRPIVPFYQWENNDGYCGEVSLLQAAMNNGQWMSQLNVRLLCGAYLLEDGGEVSASQAGPDGYCAAHGQNPYEYAQLLFTCQAGCAAAARCLSNARLSAESYETPAGQTGKAAYEAYMSWVKQKLIAGDWVTVGVLWQWGNDSEYDHIVSVTSIGTDHDPTDATYYGDDVLYLDDHGLETFRNGQEADNPGVPLGASGVDGGCTPYYFGDTFDNLGRARADMSPNGHQPYGFPMPTASASNYAFAVSGPLDTGGDTLPVTLTITGTTTNGAANPADPIASYNYENPFIGTSTQGSSCTNTPPKHWMDVTAEVTVEGLTAGTDYNLYEYDFASVTGVGSAAALAVPTSSFNAAASKATRQTAFTAMGATYSTSASFTSDQVVVFRAVPASAP
jgi:hypothetical protein